MVDWEDVWEDFDLKRGLIIIVLGILVIGGGVFLLRDYFLAQRLNDKLTADLEQIRFFTDSWKPGGTDTAKIQKQIKALRAEIESQTKILPDSEAWNGNEQDVYNAQQIETEIRKIGTQTGVKINQINPRLGGVEGYLLVEPVEVVLEGTRKTIPDFFYFIGQMRFINEIKADRISPSGPTSVTIRFFKFDIAGWEESNPCQTIISAPDIQPIDTSGVMVFKGNLASKRSQVNEKQHKLQTEVKTAGDVCMVEKELQMLQDKLALLKEKTD